MTAPVATPRTAGAVAIARPGADRAPVFAGGELIGILTPDGSGWRSRWIRAGVDPEGRTRWEPATHETARTLAAAADDLAKRAVLDRGGPGAAPAPH